MKQDNNLQDKSVRVQKKIAESGLCSRREAERLIEQGKVYINNYKANLGDTITSADKVMVGNKVCNIPWTDLETKVLIYNKPVGQICSHNLQGHESSVFDALPPTTEGRWILVGRLDVNTSGLLLITNNGELANKLMHPRAKVNRTYIAEIEGHPTNNDIKKSMSGIEDDGDVLFFDSAELLESSHEKSTFKLKLHHGRKREVRRIWQHLGYNVCKLHRTSYGPVKLLEGMSSGTYQILSADLVANLENI